MKDVLIFFVLALVVCFIFFPEAIGEKIAKVRIGYMMQTELDCPRCADWNKK